MGDSYWLLISACVCDKDGAVYRDMALPLLSIDCKTHEEAVRLYSTATIGNESAMVLYLSKFIEPDDGIYIYYEVMDEDGVSDPFECIPLI